VAINECCRFVAQTFTAGRTGFLAGVNIDVLGFGSSQLHVAIRTVANGAPTTTVLTETALASTSAPLSQLITFPEQILVRAGEQYAIVVNYDGAPPPGPDQARGAWGGAVGDAYPRGALFLSFIDGVSWFVPDPGFDVHFRTYVEGAGAAELLEGVATDLEAVVDAGAGTKLGDKAEDALAKLEAALAKLEKTPPDRQGALGELEGTVGDLEAAVKDRLLDSSEGTALLDRLAGAARLLAVEAIAEAGARGGAAGKIAEAERALQRGDAKRASGRFKDAVARYKDAASKAEGA
jgi:hypothetical protein